MSTQFKHRKTATLLSLTIATAIVLACGIDTGASSSSAPGVDATTAALQLQGTALALQMTQSARAVQPQAQAPAAGAAPAVGAPPAPAAAPAVDIEAKIKSASCVSYDGMDELTPQSLIPEIALQGMGIQCKNEGSYSGRFFADLGSGTKYDLIIAAAEAHNTITGEFWDAINTRVTRDKAALIVEMWYLDQEAYGPIYKVLSGCGLAYMKNSRLDQISWWQPTNEIFNKPNALAPLTQWNQFWPQSEGMQPDTYGNKVTLGPGGDGILLAGQQSTPSNDAVLATCNGGREVWQFFNTHDYPFSQMIPMWQNYIHYTLSNHFAATP